MGYKVTIEIEPGSAEDLLLNSVKDPAEFVQNLVTRESANGIHVRGPIMVSEIDVERISKLDPIFAFGSNFSDADLIEMQNQLLRNREAETSGHEVTV
jgi:hypothetical protein